MKKTIFVLLSLLFVSPSFAQTPNPRETPVVKVVRENAAGVVNISTEHVVYLRESPYWGSYGNDLDSLFDQFFGFRNSYPVTLTSVGSGVVVDKDGVIVTNAHVIHKASNIIVIANDGTKLEGKMVYEIPEQDLAIVKVNSAKPLTEIKLANPADLLTGETVVAIGNSLGLENSVSVGVISGKNRDFYSQRGDKVVSGLIQTDAPINPGNSGGGLLNLNGELVGINVAVVAAAQSVGFAIPVDKVMAALTEYKNNKNLTVRQVAPKTMPSQVQVMPSNPQVPSRVPQMDNQWDPFEDMNRMSEEMDRMFQNSFNRGGGNASPKGMFNSNIFYDPSFKVEDTKDGYVIQLDVAGIDQKKLDIEFNNQSLTVSGESSESTDESTQGKSVKMNSYGSFLRTIPLPEDADPNSLKTEIKGDTLFITLSKKK
jgi:S1-C subfamily serine protease/HSP20 family molecular chaperone IbpA